MNESLVGILGLLCIAAIVITLLKGRTQPAITFILYPTALAVILIIINTVAVTANYLLPESQEYLGELSTNNSMPALIIEVTSMIMMVEMVFAAVRLRRARRRISRSTEQKEQE